MKYCNFLVGSSLVPKPNPNPWAYSIATNEIVEWDSLEECEAQSMLWDSFSTPANLEPIRNLKHMYMYMYKYKASHCTKLFRLLSSNSRLLRDYLKSALSLPYIQYLHVHLWVEYM